MRNRKPVAASELMESLKGDAEYMRRKAERERRLESRDRELRKAEEPLLRELEAANLHLSSVWDLVNTDDAYPQAIPILIEHLAKSYPERIKEGIARALTVPEARGIANRTLIDEFKRWESQEVAHGPKFAAANALTVTLTEDYVDEVIGLIKDEEHKQDRVMLPHALAKFKAQRPEIRNVLELLVDDPYIGHYAKKALDDESPLEDK